MIIDKITLKNYRNYDNLNIKFCNGINIIIGDNAQGKTNILESIYFLSITRSYRTSDDINLISYGKEFAKISSKIKSSSIPKKLEITINKKNKVLSYNNNIIKKVSDFIGLLNVIVVAPEDIEIIKGSPLNRRNFFNIELSKLDRNYINIYNEYNKLLKIRNDYLKMIMLNNLSDNRYLDVINEKIIERAINIYIFRNKLINQLNSIISDIYYDITGIKELNIGYVPNIEIENFEYESIRKVLKHTLYKNFNKEVSLGMTLYGPHRDDLKFLIDEDDIKIYGSQGQQKVAIISLKLSEISIFKDITGYVPILLLDDVFSELDKKKKNKLINYINDASQVIITTNDIRDINIKKLNNVKVFEVKKNKIIEKGDKNGK